MAWKTRRAFRTISLYLSLITAARSQSLPSSLQGTVPQCAQECLESDINQHYSSICPDLTDLSCLCSQVGTEGLSLGDLVYECTYSNGICPENQQPQGLTASTVCSQLPSLTIATTTTASWTATPTQSSGAGATTSASPEGKRLTTVQVVAVIVGCLATVMVAITGFLLLCCKGKRRIIEDEENVKTDKPRKRPVSDESFGNGLENTSSNGTYSNVRQRIRDLKNSIFASDKETVPEEQKAWPTEYKISPPTLRQSYLSIDEIGRAPSPLPLPTLPALMQPRRSTETDEISIGDMNDFTLTPGPRTAFPVIHDMPDSPTVGLFIPRLITSVYENDPTTQETRHRRNWSEQLPKTNIPVDSLRKSGSAPVLNLVIPGGVGLKRNSPLTQRNNASLENLPLSVGTNHLGLRRKSSAASSNYSGEFSGPLRIVMNAPFDQTTTPPQKPLPAVPSEEEGSDIDTGSEDEGILTGLGPNHLARSQPIDSEATDWQTRSTMPLQYIRPPSSRYSHSPTSPHYVTAGRISPFRALTPTPTNPHRFITPNQTPPQPYGRQYVEMSIGGKGMSAPGQMPITPPESSVSGHNSRRATGENWSVKVDGRPIEGGHYEYEFF
jgi:hypothetical protein